MSPTPDSALADPQRVIAELRRRLAEMEERLVGALAERDEAEAQKAAIAEVLQVINSSPGDVAPVFEAVAVAPLLFEFDREQWVQLNAVWRHALLAVKRIEEGDAVYRDGNVGVLPSPNRSKLVVNALARADDGRSDPALFRRLRSPRRARIPPSRR